MQAITFQCPMTGFEVQQLFAGKSQFPERGARHFRGMNCSACAGLHFVEPSTGYVFGETVSANLRSYS